MTSGITADEARSMTANANSVLTEAYAKIIKAADHGEHKAALFTWGSEDFLDLVTRAADVLHHKGFKVSVKKSTDDEYDYATFHISWTK